MCWAASKDCTAIDFLVILRPCFLDLFLLGILRALLRKSVVLGVVTSQIGVFGQILDDRHIMYPRRRVSGQSPVAVDLGALIEKRFPEVWQGLQRLL